MADSNSQPPRCPCGFWGSAQTLGMCSKCYKDHQKKNEGTSEKAGAPSGGVLSPATLSKAIAQVPTESTAASSSASLPEKSDPSTIDKSSAQEDDKKGLAEGGLAVDTQEDSSSTSSNSSNKRDSSEVQDPDRPVQKNKKKCFKCKCKLELAVREIGRCRCDYVFCNLHRLPEQHDCIFNHKEEGREEAKKKIVKPTRHLGTSFQRMQSD